MPRVATLLSTSFFVAVSACEAEGESIGPRGGTIVSADGRLELEIAPGALADDVQITIESVDCESMDVEAIGPCYEVGPRGTGFLFPARLTVELDEGELGEVAADDLALWAQRERNWSLLADRDVDLENATLSASATYLSSFAVVPVPRHPGARK